VASSRAAASAGQCRGDSRGQLLERRRTVHPLERNLLALERTTVPAFSRSSARSASLSTREVETWNEATTRVSDRLACWPPDAGGGHAKVHLVGRYDEARADE